jgi:carbon-monoxide dehydrogenase large subunit
MAPAAELAEERWQYVVSGADQSIVGLRIPRREDIRLVTGRGRFIDDIQAPGMVEMATLRSPFAHARILSIDVTAARELPGVVDVVTGADIVGVVRPQPVIYDPLPHQRATDVLAIATDRVRWAGQVVAAVAASDRYVAEDALALIQVEYEPLPVVADLDAALAPDAARLYDDWLDNVIGEARYTKGDAQLAWDEADEIVAHRFNLAPMAGAPLETRGCVATWDPITDELDLWLGTQCPHLARDLLGETLGLPNHRVRVRVPQLGGGFGVKFDFYVEEVIAAVLSKRCAGMPVKWVEDRLESFAATSQARDVAIDIKLGARRDGTFVALQADVFGVLGGALGSIGVGPAWAAAAKMPGPYKFPNLDIRFTGVVTNRAPHGSFRGWGAPEANFSLERAIDLLAGKLGMAPAEVRRVNFPAANEFPFNNGLNTFYDSGRYEEGLDLCLAALDERGWVERRDRARAEGRRAGIGLSFQVEATAFGASRMASRMGLKHPGFDESVVRMDSTGRFTVMTGQIAMGQGIETALSQVAASAFGVPIDDVTVVSGDTSTTPFTGYGTAASRAAALGGAALLGAAERLTEKIKRIAAYKLEAAPEDLELRDRKVMVRGAPDNALSLADIGYAAYRQIDDEFPADEDLTLEGRYKFDPPDRAFAFGGMAALVEIDVTTGVTDIVDFVIVDDCGTVINPLIVDGQLQGGAAQGIAEALYEELIYDDQAQLANATFMDYAIPTFSEIPRFEIRHMVTPSPLIPGGVKGVGEFGVIGSPAAVVNAMQDALTGVDVVLDSLPVSPPRLLALIDDATAVRAANRAAR